MLCRVYSTLAVIGGALIIARVVSDPVDAFLDASTWVGVIPSASAVTVSVIAGVVLVVATVVLVFALVRLAHLRALIVAVGGGGDANARCWALMALLAWERARNPVVLAVLVLAIFLIVAQFAAFLLAFGLPTFFVIFIFWGTVAVFILIGAVFCSAVRLTATSAEVRADLDNAASGVPCPTGLPFV